MKKTLLLLATAVFMAVNLNAQGTAETVYKKMFDNSMSVVRNYHMLNTSNFGKHYGDGISYYLESLLVMYEETNDTDYLREFMEIVDEVISNRDNHISINESRPYWTCVDRPDSCQGPILYQNGLILAPMAHFIYLEKKVYTTAFGVNFSSAYTTFDNVSIVDFTAFSTWLASKVDQTYDYFETNHWVSNRGYRQYSSDDPCSGNTTLYPVSNEVDALDRNCNWGVVNVYLALAFEGTTDGILYLNHANVAARELDKCMRGYTHPNGHQYYKWGWKGWRTDNYDALTGLYKDNLPDDISHAGAVVDLIFLLNKFKTKFKSTSDVCCTSGYFTDSDILKVSNDFVYMVYDSLSYHNALNGTKYLPSSEEGCLNCDYIFKFGLGRWLLLSKLVNTNYSSSSNSPLYNMLSDFFSRLNEFPNLLFSNTGTNTGLPSYTRGGSPANTIHGLALAHRYQGYFKLQGRNSSAGGFYGGDDWQGVASGDFNNDGTSNEMVAIRNSDGKAYFYHVVANDQQATQGSLTVNFSNVGYKFASKGSNLITGGADKQWKGITTGHFASDIAGDQIAAIRESDGAIFVWRPVFNTTTQTYSLQQLIMNTSSGTNNGWVGITSGDFDSDGLDEIAAIRNSDGGIFIWDVNKNSTSYYLTTILYNNTSGSGNQWAALSAGDIDNDGRDELTAVRNSDGGIYVWKTPLVNGVRTLSTWISNNSSGAGNIWDGMTVADFSADGTKEILLHRAYDGGFFIYNINSSSLVLKGIEYFPVDANPRIFNKAKASGVSKDFLVNLRNGDGDIMLYEVDPGFVKSSLDFFTPDQGANEIEGLKDKYLLFPNPTDKQISVIGDMNSIFEIKIFNTTGSLVYECDQIKGNNIDIERFEGGMYYMQILDVEKKQHTLKFIKE